MLGVLSNSTPDSVNEYFGLTHASAKEGLKFFPGNGNIGLILHLLLVLLLAKQDNILEEGGGKWYPILTFGPGSGKMILTLLEKVIAL